jgi:predicted dehydrogenase
VAAGDDSVVSLLFVFGAGRLARFSRWRAPRARRQLRWHVVAEEGSATLLLPRRLSWTDAEGRHGHEWKSSGALGKNLLVRFHETITQGLAMEPNLEDAYRALTWFRAAAQSQSEGRRVAIASG